MSRTTREINRITTTIISMSIRLLFYALVFFLLYEGITRGYSIGHEIFSPTAVSGAPGKDMEITVKEGESVSAVAGELEKSGLIKDKLIFVIQAVFYDYEVYPGTYTLNTSMTSKEMLKLIDESGIENEKAKTQESSAESGSSSSTEAESSSQDAQSQESGSAKEENLTDGVSAANENGGSAVSGEENQGGAVNHNDNGNNNGEVNNNGDGNNGGAADSGAGGNTGDAGAGSVDNVPAGDVADEDGAYESW